MSVTQGLQVLIPAHQTGTDPNGKLVQLVEASFETTTTQLTFYTPLTQIDHISFTPKAAAVDADDAPLVSDYSRNTTTGLVTVTRGANGTSGLTITAQVIGTIN